MIPTETLATVRAGFVRHAIHILLLIVALLAVGRSCAVERDRDAQLAAGAKKLTTADSLVKVAQAKRDSAEVARDSEKVNAIHERAVRDSIWRVANARKDEARRWRSVVDQLQLASVVDSMPVPAQLAHYRGEIGRLTAAGDAVADALRATTADLVATRASDLRERARADSLQAKQDALQADLRLALDTTRVTLRDAAKQLKRPWYKKTATVVAHTGERLLWFVAGRQSTRVVP